MASRAFISPGCPIIPRRRLAQRCVRKPPRFIAAASKDWYKVLDVPRDADAATIKRAYRRAALKNHPDVSKAPDAQERFLQVQQAYNTLSDPSKRAAYDRQSSTSVGGSSWQPSGGFNAEEYVRRWRENNPMPSDLNDSFGSIFSDLFSGVQSAVNSGSRQGVMEDFVEFLEKQVEGFGVDASGYASGDDDGLDDILQSSDVDVLQAEIEDAKFLLEQLEARKAKLDQDAEGLRRRADEWGTRASRAESARDYDTRDAAKDRRADLLAEAKRLEVRSRKTRSHINKQRTRLNKIEKRLETVKARESRSETKPREKKPSVSSQENQKKAIDDELERMKRELGL